MARQDPKIYMDVHGHRATITVSNPAKKNAISQAMWSQLHSICLEISHMSYIRCVVVKGDGENFAAGADISEFEQTRDEKNAATFDSNTEAALDALIKLHVPTIALIEGMCLGGGVSLALACDYRVADAATARFAIPAAKLGIAYPFDSLRRLVATVGSAHAKFLIFSAKQIDAQKALQINLVQEICPSGSKTEARVEEIVEAISNNAPLSIAASKTLIDAIALEDLDEHALRELHEEVSKTCVASADCKEGVRAFLERRLPQFSGM
jgi:enoyl-CoA hydratase